MNTTNTTKIVLIIAQGRSGSTLMMRVLNRLPRTNIGGETGKAWSHVKTFYDTMLKAIEKGGPGTKEEMESHGFPAWYAPFSSETLLQNLRSLFMNIYNQEFISQNQTETEKQNIIGMKEISYGYGQTFLEFEQELDFFHTLFPNLLIIFNVRKTKDIMESGWWKDWEDRQACKDYIDQLRNFYQQYYKDEKHISYCHWFEYEWWSDIDKITELLSRVSSDSSEWGDKWQEELTTFKKIWTS